MQYKISGWYSVAYVTNAVFQYHPKNTQKWNLSSREWDDSSIWVGGRTSTRLSGSKLRSAFSALGEVTE
jgi:hypothetical protein